MNNKFRERKDTEFKMAKAIVNFGGISLEEADNILFFSFNKLYLLWLYCDNQKHNISFADFFISRTNFKFKGQKKKGLIEKKLAKWINDYSVMKRTINGKEFDLHCIIYKDLIERTDKDKEDYINHHFVSKSKELLAFKNQKLPNWKLNNLVVENIMADRMTESLKTKGYNPEREYEMMSDAGVKDFIDIYYQNYRTKKHTIIELKGYSDCRKAVNQIMEYVNYLKAYYKEKSTKDIVAYLVAPQKTEEVIEAIENAKENYNITLLSIEDIPKLKLKKCA